MNKLETLKTIFGHDEFRGTQEEIIDHVIAGNHCLVIMPTGMGKSLCFQIPALLSDELTVVISPLIALMKDQVDGLVEKGVDATFINSSLTKSERENRYRRVAEGGYCLLYVTPERFRKNEFLLALGQRRIGLLAIDEAHCISEWGHDFRPDYTRIAEFRKKMNNPTTIALTATATSEVQTDIIKQCGFDVDSVKMFHEGIYRPNLELRVTDLIDENQKMEAILSGLEDYPGTQILYFTLIKTLERFSELLIGKGIRHLNYHGKLDPHDRKRIQNKFMKGKNQLILATNAFGMGVDKEDVRLIIHVEVPSSPESYYQEIGRAGRDGKKSLCHLLYCQDDLATQLEFIYWRNPNNIFIESTYNLLVSCGEGVNTMEYEMLQEKLVRKNRGDHRLSTVLSVFDRYGITEGSLEKGDLKVIAELDPVLLEEDRISEKEKINNERLYGMLKYVQLETCRKNYLHEYFGVAAEKCEHCDNCL